LLDVCELHSAPAFPRLLTIIAPLRFSGSKILMAASF